MGNLIYSQLVISIGNNWDFWLVSKVGLVLCGWALNLRDMMLTPGRQCQNWVELSDTQLVLKNYLMCGKPAHLVSEILCGSSVWVKEAQEHFSQGGLIKNYIKKKKTKLKIMESRLKPKTEI